MAERTKFSRVLACLLVLAPWVGCGRGHDFASAPVAGEAGQNAGGAGVDGPDGAGGAGAANGQNDCAFTLCGGRCVDTAADPEHCGACDLACTSLPHLQTTDGVTCSAGVCEVPASACAAGYAHCSPDPADGCETDITVPEHCGSCATTCGADAPFCALGKCSVTCPAEAPTACGKACSDPKTDPMHCGDCETACTQPAGGGNAVCADGKCGTQCLQGYHQCPGTTDCRSDTDASHCGPDCLACDAPTGGHAVCADNACGIACDGGLKQCGSECIDTASDPKNCGECGHDCSALPHIGSSQGITCSAGKCVVPSTSCAAGYAHCSAKPDDGCETDISQADNCRACGTKCPVDNPICTPTGCKNACAASAPTLCGGNTCADLNTDANHCGDCATKCTQPASGGSTVCEGKKCVLKCLTGYHPCGDSSCVSDTDASQCGASCVQCPGAANGSAKCVSNACTIQCNSGYHACANGTCASNADENKCESTCKVCPATANGSGQCSNNSCTVACNSGYHKCSNGTCAADNDKSKCTASCSACADPANGTAACSGNVCVTASCKTNYHQCPDSSCASNSDKDKCTNSCTVCPQVANAVAPTCVSNACVTVCLPGFKACNGKCVDPAVDNSCGGHPLAAGDGVACAIKSGGAVWCWNATDLSKPTQVGNLSSAIQLSVFREACALKSDGTIWCWSAVAPLTPASDKSAGMKFKWVAVSADPACRYAAVASTDKVYCWDGSKWGQKGTISATHVSMQQGSPYDGYARGTDGSIWKWVSGDVPIRQYSSGYAEVSMYKAEGYGEALVLRTTAGVVSYNRAVVDVGALAGSTAFTQISSGTIGGCAIDTVGKVGCWGYGPYGQLGNGTFPQSDSEMDQYGGSAFRANVVARGELFTCALKTDGTVWCVGKDVAPGDGLVQQVNLVVP